jgi:excisionase family DNA binding protein
MPENTIETIGLKEAAELAHTNRNYLLKLLNSGKLPGEKVQRGDTEVTEWRIPKDTVIAWAENKGSRTSRPDGRHKYMIYLNDDELEAVVALGLEPTKVIYKGKSNRVAQVDEPNTASPDEHTADEVGPESAPKRKRGKKLAEAAAELFAE